MNQPKSVIGLCLAVCTIAITGCNSADTEIESPLRPVRYVVVEDTDGQRSRTFSGTSRSTQVSRLSFKVGGNVVELPIEVGDKLAKGDLIARLDSSSFDLEVQQAQASLVQARANERNAQANYQRVQGLYANNNTSRNELDSARANAESTRAQTRSLEKSLELARLNRSYTRLVSDRECAVSSLSVDLNENVSAGAEVATVNCGDSLEIRLSIPESLIADVKPDSSVAIRFSAIPELEFLGTVQEIGVGSSNGSPTFPVIVSIDGSERRLRSGLAAEVTLNFSGQSEAGVVLLPLAAVANTSNEPFVFVAVAEEGGGTALLRKQFVSVGELTAGGIQIRSGLNVGDRVVTAGVSVVREGQRVLLN